MMKKMMAIISVAVLAILDEEVQAVWLFLCSTFLGRGHIKLVSERREYSESSERKQQAAHII